MSTRCCGPRWERMRELSPEAEQAWRSLRRHLERSERFTLAFLASADPPALDEVRRRLEAALQFRASRLEILALQDAPPGWAEQLEVALVPDAGRTTCGRPRGLRSIVTRTTRR